MKQFYSFTFLLALVFLLGGCSADNLSFDTVNQRIIGAWKAKKVEVKNDSKRDRFDEITDQYEGYVYTFLEGGSLEISNVDLGVSYTGWWYLEQNVTFDDDGDEETEYTLFAEVYDPNSNIFQDFSWRIRRITNNLLKAEDVVFSSEMGISVKYRYRFVPV